jgi:DNA-binding IclR family transcriptional regulator
MGLNLSNQQIAQELELNQADVHEMTTFLRQALFAQRQPPVRVVLRRQWRLS